jgi:3-ketoacyl-CoA synthase
MARTRKRPCRVDCIAFEALDAETHLRRVSNAEYLAYLRRTVWRDLSLEKRALFEKLLASDRARYIAGDTLDEFHDDTHERRYRRYKTQLERCTLRCVDALIARAEVPTSKIALVVTNHTVGGICPPLSSLIAHHLRLGPSVQAIDLGYMGCAAGIWGVELASRLLQPGEGAVILSAELTSVMTNLQGATESLVASCVCGDGVGAFLVAAPPHPFKTKFRVLDYTGSLITSDSGMDCIRYEPNPVYHEIRLKDTILQVAGEGIREALEPLVQRRLVSLPQKAAALLNRRQPRWQRNVDYVVLHTAGNKILDGLTTRLGLSESQTAHNSAAFRKYGNTSSASVYYSLRELESMNALRRGNRLLFLAFGSGFMTKGMYAAVA